ncbi:MAG TPA: histidine triad nucleotide-binding protein [Candidatus Limiplasma sp.]|nr:histidine triad nucleotide-binding protein [Candidatus Limiplasma sp.]HRX09504.1 histidine triad nucleotide-binding protein [Candidatus Limiplasma sp.]
MDNCLFCKIISGEIPSKKIYEDELTYAFHDISPQARVHALVIPKRHVSGLSAADELTDTQLAACLRTCQKVAAELGIEASGYRVVSNCGPDACQTVNHLHFHVIGGNEMSAKMA